jgi:hypothetical protein
MNERWHVAISQGIRAGRAFVEVGVRDKRTAGLRRTQKRFKAFGLTLNMAAAGQPEIAQAADIAAKVTAGRGIKVKALAVQFDDGLAGGFVVALRG